MKYPLRRAYGPCGQSHPTGVRGLKLPTTPHQRRRKRVAPHWGAWIEIHAMCFIISSLLVAPHWGAWIEIYPENRGQYDRRSHPTGVRGLKLPYVLRVSPKNLVAPHWGAWIEILIPTYARSSAGSHPTGVRGLKSGAVALLVSTDVAPHWGAWIEMTCRRFCWNLRNRRTPLGCVD